MKRIDVLPDDVLLGIFDFYVDISRSDGGRKEIEAWQSLVHVCRRWRSLVFQSPRRLNLRLYCTPDTPARDKLDIWPALPLIVYDRSMAVSLGTDNIIAALGQSNRICQVEIYDLLGAQLENVLAAMQVPFPELNDLRLSSLYETLPVIPDSFLGGSAPRLRHFALRDIPFPGLPKLLLSANHLVHLSLIGIPRSGYISPEAMIALLSALSSLRTLYLEFQSSQSHPGLESRSLPPLKPTILPALNRFHFKGVTGYLEVLVTRIDTPQLDEMYITFFDQIDCPRLAQFVNRTPTFGAYDKAQVKFCDRGTAVLLQGRSSTLQIHRVISCREPHQQLSSVAQICNSSLRPLSTVGDLYIKHQCFGLVWEAIENTRWLQLLLPFTAVENLSLSKQCTPRIAAALKELVGGRISEVLPSLQNISVERPRIERWGTYKENIRQFVAARQLSGHPITFSIGDEDSDDPD